jgi:hypothetical protein
MSLNINAVTQNNRDINNTKLADIVSSSDEALRLLKQSEKDYERKVAACKPKPNINQFDQLTLLANNVNKQDPKRCGWIYNSNDYTKGRGAFGSIIKQDDIQGEEKTPGEWMWNLDAAKKRYHIDHCTKGVKTCRQIGEAQFNKKCGWCKEKGGRGVPIDSKGELAYPTDSSNCLKDNLVEQAALCSREGFTGTILPNTPISRNQIYNQIINPGNYETGAINYSLNVGSQDNSFDDISKKKAWKIYHKRALYPVNESSLSSSRLTEKHALNGFDRKVDRSMSGANNSLVFSGRNLSCNKGINDKYDFGIESQFNLLR